MNTGTPDVTTFELGSPSYLGKGDKGDPGERGADGADGKSAYESAQDGGYTGTEAQFNSDLADVGEKIGEAPNDGKLYARKNRQWTELSVLAGGSY